MTLGERLKAMLDGIWNAGRTPYVRVDLPVPGLPEYVGKERGAAGGITFALSATYPLNLVYTDDGFQVDLAFSGAVVRCTVYWAAVQGISDGVDPGLIYARARVDRPTPTAPPPPPLAVIPGGPPKLTLIRGGKS